MSTNKVYQHWIEVTDKAVSVLEDSFKVENIDPKTTFVRIGATPGGCSGWTFLIETTESKKSRDDFYHFGNIKFIVYNV